MNVGKSLANLVCSLPGVVFPTFFKMIPQLKEFTSNGFGAWDNYHSDDLTHNVCNGPLRKQSPKDLVSTYPCEAKHEIRTKVRFVLPPPRRKNKSGDTDNYFSSNSFFFLFLLCYVLPPLLSSFRNNSVPVIP